MKISVLIRPTAAVVAWLLLMPALAYGVAAQRLNQGLDGDAALESSLSGSLTVNLQGMRSDEGQIAIAVFPADAEGSFPKENGRAVLTKLVDSKKGDMEISLGTLKPGVYAVSVLHDENRDGKMNFNFIGMPREGFGFSENPTIRFGAPSFKDCAITVDGQQTSVSIRTKYF